MAIKALITGAAGQLGQELLSCAPEEIVCRGLGHSGLDISSVDSIAQAIEDNQPDVIINTAAYTAVDKAESEPANAWRVNAAGAENLARQCTAASIQLIHISTDYVFDGNASSAYTPESRGNPLGEYGRSKLAGEEAVQAFCPGATIFRSGWIYSEHGNNFVKTMLRLMQDRETLSVVSDQTGAPTWARGLAHLCWRAVADSVASSGSAAGIYHWSDRGECSWYEFALAIYEEATKMSVLNKAVLLEPISTADYAAAARRPAYTVLDTTMTEQRFATHSIPWRQQLCSMLAEMKASRHV